MDHDLALTVVWLDDVPRDAADQMALDEALLDLGEEGVHCLRLYRWTTDTVSFGANESAGATWDRAALAASNIPCVRRPTGGRAVWHSAEDLTYAWTGPVASLGGVRPAYATLHRRLAAALAPLDLEATLAERPARLPGLAPGGCFDLPVGGELLIAGRKAIGSAQMVRRGALLQHGAIARRDRTARLDGFRRVPQAAAVPSPQSLPESDRVAAAIASWWLGQGALAAWPELTRAASEASLPLAPRYHDPGWTWRR